MYHLCGGGVCVRMRDSGDHPVYDVRPGKVHMVSGSIPDYSFDAFKVLEEKLAQKKFLTEYTLIILATIGAFGVARYVEGVLVMLLFELGMMFEAYSTDSAKRSIKELIDIRPEYATRKVHGKEFKVDPSALKLGHIIVIKPGERIPVDAVVVSGYYKH